MESSSSEGKRKGEKFTCIPMPSLLNEAGEYQPDSAIAEIIDNSIEYTFTLPKFDETDEAKLREIIVENDHGNELTILDNGCGMTKEGLQNWAVLSKVLN